MPYTRRLVAIMFTDIVGYTRLMQESEQRGIALLERHRRVIDDVHAARNGRVIKYMGDGTLSIFDSVIDCVHASISIQEKLLADPAVPLRIGIHVGDVMITDTDIIGDSVNLASRVESLGVAGSVLVSNKVQEELKNHPIPLALLGAFHFKNDEMPRDIYAVTSKGLVIPQRTDLDGKLEEKTHSDRTNEEQPVELKSQDEALEDQVRSIILSHLADDKLSVTFLCKMVGYSRPQLYRRLQAIAGKSPSEFIREIRLEEAAKLLEQNVANVSEIAFQTGFNNLSYFSKAFQDRFGHPPSVHAKQSRRRSSVPTELTNFIGREKELTEISDQLSDIRLLTLSGPGGTGKTRLSLQILQLVEQDFADGAYFVQLAPLTDHGQVLPKIAQILNLRQDPTKETTELLQDFIESKNLLLVLDNFEHVLGASIELAKILRTCPNLKVLVTSRIVLNISGEYEYRVPGLDLPDPSQEYEIRDLEKIAAVQFFIDRVQRVKPNFALDQQNCSSIVTICNQLDGLPLALELAAARIKLFSPEALVRRLNTNKDILKSNAPDQPERHRSLSNAIDWSYNLLSPEEQTLFRGLAVFGGGCTIESAEQVCFQNYYGNADIVDVLLGLVDKSLVQRVDQEDGEPRFYMLETIRAYGLNRLEKSLEKKATMTRFCDYFLDLVADAEKGLTGPDAKQWLEITNYELDNLRACMGWLDVAGVEEKGLQLCISFWRFWLIRAMVREGAQWFERMLEIPPKTDSVLRCRALQCYGVLSMIANSLSIFEESLEMAKRLNYREGVAQALKYITWIYAFQCEFDLFESYSSQALDTLLSVGNDRDIAAIYNNIANKLRLEGKLDESLSMHHKAAQIMSKIGDYRGHAFNLCHISWVQSLRGDYDGCNQSLDTALPTLTDLADKQLLGFVNTLRAFNCTYTGDYEQSSNLIEVARPLWRESNNDYGDRMCNVIAAMNWLKCGRHEQLHHLFAQEPAVDSAKMYRTMGLWIKQMQIRFLIQQNQWNEAADLVTSSIKEQASRRMQLILSDDLEIAAQILCHQHKYADAARLFAFARLVRARTGVVVPPIWRDEHTRLHDVIRSQLSPEEYDQTVGEDASLSLATVIDFLHVLES